MINAGNVVAFMELDTSKFSNGLSSAGQQLKQFFDSSNNIESRIQGLGGSIQSVGATATKALTIPLLGAATAATKLASDFETGMAKISTIADTKQVSMKDMAQGIKDLSMEAGVDPSDVQNAVYESISSGIQTKDALGFVTQAKKAAIGGFTDSETAVNGLTTILNAFNMAGGDVIKTTNEIGNQMMIAQNLGKTTFGEMAQSIGNVAPTAAAAGVSTKELFSSIAVLTANGLQTGEAMTGIKAALSNIIKPSDQASKAAAALGLNFNVAELKSKGWMGFLSEVKDKVANVAPAYAAASNKVAQLQQQLADAQGNKQQVSEKYTAMINNEKNAITDLEKQKSSTTDKKKKDQIQQEIDARRQNIKVMQQEEAQAKKAYSPQQISDLKKQLTAAQKEQQALQKASGDKLSAFGTMFGSVEALNSVMALTSDSGQQLYGQSMGQMNDGHDYLSDSYNKMEDTPEMKMKKAEESIKVAMIDLGEAFLPYVGQIAEGISKLMKAFQALPAPVKDAIGKAVVAMALLGPGMLIMGRMVSGVGTFIGVFKNIGPAVGGAINIFSRIGSAGSTAINIFSKMGSVGSSIIGVFGKIGPATLNVAKFFGGMGSSILEFVKVFGKIGAPIMNGIKFIGSLGTAAMDAIKAFNAVRTASGIFSALPMLLNPPILIAVAIIAALGIIVYEVIKHWDAVKSAASNFGNFLKNVFSGIGDFFKKSIEGWKQIFSSPLTFLKDSFQGWKMLGSALIDGFTNGFNFDKLKKIMTDGANFIKSTFANILGIHSPSVVFTEFGVNTGQGYIRGIDNIKGSVADKMIGLSNTIKDKFGNVQLGMPNVNFAGLGDMNINGLYDASNNGDLNPNNKPSLLFNPNIEVHVTLSDTGKQGTQELTDSLKTMVNSAVKDGMVEHFLRDAYRL